jgi:large repetitive protein
MGLGAYAVSLLLILLLAPAASATVLPKTISTNTTLTAAASPYIGSDVTVKPGIALTAEPGVVIKLTGSIFVDGILNLTGTSVNPVIVTSTKDDSAGGDTNNDGANSSPAPGNWGEVHFSSTGSGSLEHADVRYGGSPSGYTTVQIKCPCSNQVTIANSSISHSKYVGVKLYRAEAKILNSTISENGGTGIQVISGSPEITGNAVKENGEHGIGMASLQEFALTVDVDGNLIEGNARDGIEIKARTAYTRITKASLGENVIVGNGEKGVEYDVYSNPAGDPAYQANPVPPDIDTNVLNENIKNGIWLSGEVQESTSWQGNDYAIVMPAEGLVIGPEATLTLEPGVLIKGELAGTIQVRGELVTEGSPEEAITFTSIKDDSIGGDTNGDGLATMPAPGDWLGIKYPDAEGDELQHVRFKYAAAAIDIEFLDLMTILDSDFVRNRIAVEVEETANNAPELAGLACVPPYLSFVAFVRSWFSPFGLPAPNMNLSSVIGAAIPEGYGPFFGPALALASEVQPNYKGAENQIPFSIYSCPALGIPPIPVTPVVLYEPRVLPNFP